MADLAVWQRTIVDEEGNVVPGAEVEVRREEDGSLATLYADRAGETPLANPLTADMSGFVRFFAQGDAYIITAVGAGSTRTWRFDPIGRLKEFDKVVAEVITDDAGEQADIRDKIGAVARDANLFDLSNLKEARANLGAFSTVADVENSHIPPVLDSIRTNGYYSPGDGGDAQYRRKLALEADKPGDITSADGARWGLVSTGEISVLCFGAKPDGDTSSATVNSTAFQDAFDFAKGATVFIPPGVYCLDRGLKGYSNSTVVGLGTAQAWQAFYTEWAIDSDGGVDLVFVGTGPKDRAVYGVTSNEPAGGVRVDPDTGLEYRLTSFHNADATDTTAATQRLFSAGIDASNTRGFRLQNVRLIPAFQSGGSLLGGYVDSSNMGWSDEWDVGLLLDNARSYVIENVFAVGHWRIGGIVRTATGDPKDSQFTTDSQFGKVIGGQFTGKVGHIQRGGDSYAVTGVSSDTVSVPWHSEFPLPHDGGHFECENTRFTYTSWTKSGDNVVLNGVSPSPTAVGVTTDSSVRVGRSAGFQGCEMRGVTFHGIEHSSGYRCTDSALSEPFDTPSKIHEVTGVPAANLRMTLCTHMTQEDCAAHIFDASNVFDTLGYWESKPASGGFGRGARFIAQNSWTDNNYADYPRGTVHRIVITASRMMHMIDLSPVYARSSEISRFNSDGLFECRRARVEEAETDITNQTHHIIRSPDNKSIRFETNDGQELFELANIGNFRMLRRARFNTGTEDVYRFYARDGSTELLQINNSVSTPDSVFATRVRPAEDDTYNLGTNNVRWANAYVASGVVSSSDERLKQDIEPIPDEWLDAWGDVQFSRYRFRAAVETKGEAARWHVGLIAQRVRDAFLARGIDPFQIGLLCYDEWDEQPEEIDPETGLVDTPYRPAGDRYAIRYDEALAMEAAWTRRELQRLADTQAG